LSALILLARHGHHREVGHVLSGRSDIPLDTQGADEARRLAGRLADVPLRAVYSSPRRRACETAAPIAARHGLDVTIVDALDEIDFGAWSGQRFDALDWDPAWRYWNAARGSARCPGGEGMAEAVTRARDHIEAIAQPDTPVLCVSHCDIIRGLVAHYLGLSADRLFRFDVDPGSVTTLSLHPGGGRVVALNERLS
jgi:broad specificity phosphatase PhoE